MTSKIKVENFSFHYGEKKALDNINLQIEERKITALIGPSGCGKSTFLRSLNRMNDFINDVKYEGKILINNNDILTENIDTIELRKSVGMVFQKPNVFPKSIYENVIYGPKRYGIKDKNKLDEIVESSLKRAALWNEVKDVLDKSAFRLSGGQQQRLCIARALASKPDVILMDEPTSALDPISTLKIEELMEELKENYTVVVVTHNMEQAARTSDYTAFFLNGELIEMDITNNIFFNPKNKKTEDYISGRFG
ncbi:phosphate ABC transporter ATP-binding protein PstB [Clostridium sp. UBA6640]|uniref:phosphate ABC transporter ATP-binding protein PstB n=1 Tax=Clostridium sp. UBA6640 TaxID=1946370 RepID=UPI0025BD3A39|nr:phosphate ABC transporter ATP-binding protein PstB [Clostridium sp. UBA6640]